MLMVDGSGRIQSLMMKSAWGIGNAVQEELYKRLRSINIQSEKSTTGIAKKVATSGTVQWILLA